MLEKGLTHPLKATNAFLLIQPGATFDTPMRVKINTIQRFMMLCYRDEYDAMVKQEKIDKILPPLESIGTINNLKSQSHKENYDDLATRPHDDIQGFLTKAEKDSLADETSGTQLIITKDGKKKRTRSPNGTHKARKKT